MSRWIKKEKEQGTNQPLPKNTQEMLSEMSSRLRDLGNENVILKRLVAEKDVENAILKELLDKVNPQ